MKKFLQRHSASIFFAALALLTLGIYLFSLSNELIFDDARLTDGTVFQNYGGLLDVRQRMISYGSFVWLDAIFPHNWAVQRLANIAIHLAVAYSVFLLFDLLLKQMVVVELEPTKSDSNISYRTSLVLGVALFTLNPVATYAVAYLIQRSILLATLFTVLALWAFVRGLINSTSPWRWFFLALLFYFLAVLSKEQSFVAIAIAVPVYIYVKRPDWKAILLIACISLMAIGGVGAVLFQVYGKILGTAFDESSRHFVAQLENVSPGIGKHIFGLSVINQMALFFQYGFLWLFPNVGWMSIDLRPPFPLSMAEWRSVLGVVAYCGLLIASAWAVLRRSDALALAGLCLLMPLLMYSTEFITVWVQDPFVLYRSYLWAIGLPGLVALGLAGLPWRLVFFVTALVAMLLAALTFERIDSLKSEMLVWSDAVEKVDLQAPLNAVGRWRAFLNRGTAQLDRSAYEEALQDFSRAATLGEPYGSARFSMGVSLQLMKRHTEALAAFAQARAQGFNEAALFYHQGESLHALGRFAEALESYSASLGRAQEPKAAQHTKLRRAEAAMAAGQIAQALEEFQLLAAQAPGDRHVKMALGMAYVSKDDPVAALAVFDELISNQPSAMAYYGRAIAHYVAGRRAQSKENLDQAIALDPKNPMFSQLRDRLASGR